MEPTGASNLPPAAPCRRSPGVPQPCSHLLSPGRPPPPPRTPAGPMGTGRGSLRKRCGDAPPAHWPLPGWPPLSRAQRQPHPLAQRGGSPSAQVPLPPPAVGVALTGSPGPHLPGAALLDVGGNSRATREASCQLNAGPGRAGGGEGGTGPGRCGRVRPGGACAVGQGALSGRLGPKGRCAGRRPRAPGPRSQGTVSAQRRGPKRTGRVCCVPDRLEAPSLNLMSHKGNGGKDKHDLSLLNVKAVSQQGPSSQGPGPAPYGFCFVQVRLAPQGCVAAPHLRQPLLCSAGCVFLLLLASFCAEAFWFDEVPFIFVFVFLA